MFRKLFSAGVLAIILASCSDEKLDEPVASRTPINYCVSADALSRAFQPSFEPTFIPCFKVAAYRPGSYSGDGYVYIEGDVMQLNDEGTEYFNPNGLRYWAPDPLSFVAVAGCRELPDFDIDTSSNVYINNYKVDTADPQDLLIAVAHNVSGDNGGNVDLEFKHALAKVRINVMNYLDFHMIPKIYMVNIEGVDTEGSIMISPYNDQCYWSNLRGSYNRVWGPYLDGEVVAGDPVPAGEYLMIPQYGRITFHVCYTIQCNWTGMPDDYNDLYLAGCSCDYEEGEVSIYADWEAGEVYTYNITFKAMPPMEGNPWNPDGGNANNFMNNLELAVYDVDAQDQEENVVPFN